MQVDGLKVHLIDLIYTEYIPKYKVTYKNKKEHFLVYVLIYNYKSEQGERNCWVLLEAPSSLYSCSVLIFVRFLWIFFLLYEVIFRFTALSFHFKLKISARHREFFQTRILKPYTYKNKANLIHFLRVMLRIYAI